MTLADLSSLGSFISGIAVLVSLIYLSLQVRQNTKHTRALIFQGGASRATSNFLALASSDLATATVVGNGETGTPDEVRRRQFISICQSFYVNWDDIFSQHEEGLISDDRFERFRWALVVQLKQDPGIRKFIAETWLSDPSSDFKFHTFLRDAIANAEAATAPD